MDAEIRQKIDETLLDDAEISLRGGDLSYQLRAATHFPFAGSPSGHKLASDSNAMLVKSPNALGKEPSEAPPRARLTRATSGSVDADHARIQTQPTNLSSPGSTSGGACRPTRFLWDGRTRGEILGAPSNSSATDWSWRTTQRKTVSARLCPSSARVTTGSCKARTVRIFTGVILS